MSSIQRIETLLSGARGILSECEAKLGLNPASFFYQGLLKNTEEDIAELTAELVHEKKKREVEILELRLTGKLAKNGTLPLDILGKIASSLADALIHASKQIHAGSKKSAQVLQEVKQTLDLRFAFAKPGSTRIFITGQTNPDLFGHSLIEQSLENTFGVLKSSSADELLEYASRCGSQSVKNLKNFISSIDSNYLEVDMDWESPSNKNFNWEGSKSEMQLIKNSLASIESEKPQELEIEAVLIGSSLKGTFEIKDGQRKTYKGRYPAQLLEMVQEIRIGDDCYCVVEETRTKNRSTNHTKYSYLLKSIEKM